MDGKNSEIFSNDQPRKVKSLNVELPDNKTNGKHSSRDSLLTNEDLIDTEFSENENNEESDNSEDGFLSFNQRSKVNDLEDKEIPADPDQKDQSSTVSDLESKVEGPSSTHQRNTVSDLESKVEGPSSTHQRNTGSTSGKYSTYSPYENGKLSPIKARGPIRKLPSNNIVPECNQIHPGLSSIINKSRGVKLLIVSIVLALVAAVSAGLYIGTERTTAPKEMGDFLQFMSDEYPTQNIDEFRLFVKQVKFAKKTNHITAQSTVFTLLYDNSTEIANKIGTEMAKFAAQEFHNSENIFSLNGLDISHNYFPKNVLLLKNSVNDTGTLLVTNFDKISSEAVTFFHMICDKYTPFLRDGKAVYILVLKTTDQCLLGKDTLEEWKSCAKSTMISLWSDLEEEILSPLIVRLTENVIKIYPS